MMDDLSGHIRRSYNLLIGSERRRVKAEIGYALIDGKEELTADTGKGPSCGLQRRLRSLLQRSTKLWRNRSRAIVDAVKVTLEHTARMALTSWTGVRDGRRGRPADGLVSS